MKGPDALDRVELGELVMAMTDKLLEEGADGVFLAYDDFVDKRELGDRLVDELERKGWQLSRCT